MFPPPVVWPLIWLKISCGPEKCGETPADIGADRERARHVEHFAAGQPPQGVGRADVAQLREQGRIHQLGHQRAGPKRGEARLGAADDRAAAGGDRAQPGLVAADDRRDRDVDRLRGENQPGAAEAMDLEIEAAGAVGLPGIIEPAGRRAGQVEVGPKEIEHVERHGAKLGVDFGRRAAAARNGGIAAGKADAGRGERPAVARTGQHRGLVEHQGFAVDPAAAAQANGVGGYLGEGREGEGRAAAAGKGGADLTAAVDQLGIGGEARERDRARGQAACIDAAVERRLVVGEDDNAVGAAAADGEGVREIGVGGGDMGVDPLRLAGRREVERAAEGPVGKRQAAAEPARF